MIDTLLPTEDLAAWLRTQTWSEFAQSLADYHDRKGFLSEKQEASARSMHAKVSAKQATKVVTEAVTEDGMYKTPEGDIYKVQISKQGSGNLYAKKLEQDEYTGKWGFAYAQGAIRKLTPNMRMSLEEAKEWGQLYSTCCVCGRDLTDEISVAEGIGPICSGRV